MWRSLSSPTDCEGASRRYGCGMSSTGGSDAAALSILRLAELSNELLILQRYVHGVLSQLTSEANEIQRLHHLDEMRKTATQLLVIRLQELSVVQVAIVRIEAELRGLLGLPSPSAVELGATLREFERN